MLVHEHCTIEPFALRQHVEVHWALLTFLAKLLAGLSPRRRFTAIVLLRCRRHGVRGRTRTAAAMRHPLTFQPSNHSFYNCLNCNASLRAMNAVRLTRASSTPPSGLCRSRLCRHHAARSRRREYQSRGGELPFRFKDELIAELFVAAALPPARALHD